MRILKLGTFFFLMFFMAMGLHAKELTAVVKLSNIKVEKSSDRGGDEFYFNITYYSSLGHSKNIRIPESPTHWLSQHVETVKDINLWTGTLAEGEEVRLILSIVEQDYPPWDPDDLIGGVELILKNEKGKLKKKWDVPTFEERVEVEMKKPGNPQTFIFKGDEALYDVAFIVNQQ